MNIEFDDDAKKSIAIAAIIIIIALLSNLYSFIKEKKEAVTTDPVVITEESENNKIENNEGKETTSTQTPSSPSIKDDPNVNTLTEIYKEIKDFDIDKEKENLINEGLTEEDVKQMKEFLKQVEKSEECAP